MHAYCLPISVIICRSHRRALKLVSDYQNGRKRLKRLATISDDCATLWQYIVGTGKGPSSVQSMPYINVIARAHFRLNIMTIITFTTFIGLLE